MFISKNSFHMNTKKIRGVNYAVFSIYDGDTDVFEYFGKLIENSFESSTADEITSESLVENGIDEAAS